MSDYFECTPVGLDFLDKTPNVYKAEEIVRATPGQIFDVFEDAVSWTVWAPPMRAGNRWMFRRFKKYVEKTTSNAG